jgi:hypothetical protein
MPKSESGSDNKTHQSRFALRRFRFSLAWMLICVTAIAVALGLSMVIGSFVATLLFAIVYCVLPTPLVIFAIFARGDTQAFAIGALIPWGTSQTWMPHESSFSNAVWLLTMCTVCGAVAAVTRRWIRFTGT